MSLALAKTLNEKRQNLWEQAKGIIDAAENDKRPLSAEETRQFEGLSGQMTDLKAQCDMLIAADEQNRAADEALRSKLGNAGAPAPDERDLAAEFRRVARGEIRGFDIAAPAGPRTAVRSAIDGYQSRVLVKGTTTAGGHLVPTSFYNQVVQFMVDTSSILQLGPTTLETDGGESIDVPIVTSYGSAAQIAEGGTIPAMDPAFGKRTLGAYKYGGLVQISYELLNDTGFDLQGFIARVGGRNVGLALDAKLAVGTGSSEPAGAVPSATVGVTGGTGQVGKPTADELIDLFYSVASPYRDSPDAGWLVKDTTMAVIRKLKDTTGQYLFQQALVAGTPDVLLGKPIKTDPNVAATALNAKSVVFGDWASYWVRFAGNLRFERSDDFAFDKDLSTFRVLIRADGLLVDQTGALKTYVGAAS